MPTHSLRPRPLLLTLLLAACGPGQADPDAASDAGSDTGVGGPSTGVGGPSTSDGPTSDGPTSGGTGGGTTGTSGEATSEFTTDRPPGDTSTGDTSTDGGSSGSSTAGDTSTGDGHRARLIGLAFVADTQVCDVVELDRDTAELTVLTALPPSITSIGQGVGAFDPATRRIYQTTGDGRLLALDADTGQFIAAPALAPAGLAGVVNLELNNAGELMALVLGDQLRTVRIDPDTGVVTPLAALPAHLGSISLGTGAHDPATDRMIQLSGDGNLVVIDAGSGDLLGEVLVTPPGGLIELAFDNAGALVGLTVQNFPEPWEFSRVDPLTGVVTKLSELPGPVSFIQGQIVHDPAVDQMILLTGESTLVVIDPNTGELLANKPIVTGEHVAFFNPEVVL